MKQRSFSTAFCFALLALLLAGTFLGCATTQTPSAATSLSTATPGTPPGKETAAPPSASVQCCTAPYYPPPDKIDLCGEPVPLDVQDVQERFDREFTLIVYNHAQVYLWLKRMERYFPWIEERLRYYNLPEDLKYVAIVESDLLPNACSPKGAAGPWQFMPSTGAAYGLTQQGSCDRRYDFERSTDSAFRLLRDLYARHKNWALALAAYNCGDRRVYDEMRIQRVTDYYHLRLPEETERYVIRILAVKAVLGNPAQYGYALPKGWGYPELKLDRVTVTLSSSVPIPTIASAAGITYREFKRLNPVFRADDVPPGTHELKLPEGTGKIFERNFNPSKVVSTSPMVTNQPETDKPTEAPSPTSAPAASSKPQTKLAAPAASYHTVKKGETLFSIAQQCGVSVEELRQANNIKGNVVIPGQKLTIP
jgi:membrane-bound lytic murein transglycosylase D